jgi:enamine deaminase RidA (YjgF/YER057c/UK114 family)
MESRVSERGRLVCVERVTSHSSGGVGEQTREALARVEQLLADSGSHKSKLLTAEIRLADMSLREEHEAAWNAWVDPASRPLRVLKLAAPRQPEALVEIMVTALK